MVRIIAEEADTEAAAIVAAARVRADGLVGEARAAADARLAAALARAEPAIRAEAVRRVNAARLRLLERRAELIAGRTAAVFQLAGERLAEIADGAQPERWRAALGRLAAEAIELAGPGAEVDVRVADAGSIAATVEAAGARLVALGPDRAAGAANPGVVVRSSDGRIEVDATLPARLERARHRLAETVAARLGPNPAGEGGGQIPGGGARGGSASRAPGGSAPGGSAGR